jgi:hypothetical protein
MRGGSCRPVQKNAVRQHLHRGIDTVESANSVRAGPEDSTCQKRGNSILQRLRLLKKIARIGSGPWSWTASLPQGGCLILFPIRTQSAHRHARPPLNPLLDALINPGRTSSGRWFDQHQRLDHGLLLGKVRFLIRKAGDVARRVALGDQPSAVGQRGSTNSRCQPVEALPCLAPRTSTRTRRNRATGCRFILRLV